MTTPNLANTTHRINLRPFAVQVDDFWVVAIGRHQIILADGWEAYRQESDCSGFSLFPPAPDGYERIYVLSLKELEGTGQTTYYLERCKRGEGKEVRHG